MQFSILIICPWWPVHKAIMIYLSTISLTSVLVILLAPFPIINGEEGDDFTLPPLPTLPSVGVCQTYNGKLCSDYLKDAYVFVPPNKTVQDVETEISTVFNIFRQSK